MHSGVSPLMKILNKNGTIHDYLRISQWGEYNKTDAEYFLKILFNILR
jgi:hypothetical protein